MNKLSVQALMSGSIPGLLQDSISTPCVLEDTSFKKLLTLVKQKNTAIAKRVVVVLKSVLRDFLTKL